MPDLSRIAVSYARYSSGSQRDVSIEQQHHDNRLCAEREGLTIVGEYSDHAKSGFKDLMRRTEFAKMMQAAEDGKFGVIICWKVDRFGRNREESAVFKGRLRRHGVRVLYAKEPIPDGSAGILLEGMLEATAEWYSVTLSENVRRGLQSNAEKCLFNGNQLFGYRPSPDHHYAIEPSEAATVREIYSAYESGMSLSRIASMLAQRGIRTTRGYPWRIEPLRRVLTNERYTGVYIYSSVRVEGGIPAIITKEQFERVQVKLKHSTKPHARNNVLFLLTGKLFCGHCGGAMVGDSGTSKSGVTHFYYSCSSHKRLPSSCKKKSVRKDDIESRVVNFLLDVVLTDSMIDRLATAILLEQQKDESASVISSLESELRSTRRRIDNLNRAIADGIYTSSTKDMLLNLEANAQSLSDSIAAARFAASSLITKEQLVFWMSRFRSIDRADFASASRLIDTFVNSIYLFDDRLSIYINTVAEEQTLSFSDLQSLSPCSDNVTSGSLVVTHPNTFAVLRHGKIVCFTVTL